ncbi:MAG: aspartate aminotransferase family protein [Candidatus Bathyarchaeia archaeon]
MGDKLRRAVPGPKNLEWIQRDEKVIGKVTYIRFYPMVVESGLGSIVTDLDGNNYIDFQAGAAVANIGYCHPKVVKAVEEQMKKLTHNCFALFSNQITVKLAEKLVEITPGNFPKKVWFGLSGSDANDCVFKLARFSTKRDRIISFLGSYHGQTMGAYSLSGHKAESHFLPFPGVIKVPYAYCYRCAFKMKHPDCGLQCIKFIEEHIFTSICPPEDAAGILVEPIQGDSGMIVPPDDFLLELKRICEENGMLFMVDEVRTGFGRTGKMFAINHLALEPDLIVMAKPMASGFPISACVARAEILDSPIGSHLLTTGGSPIGAAAALANIQVLMEEKLCDKAARTGAYMLKRLEEMKEGHELIGDVRGKGLFIGVEFVRNRKTKEPASIETHKVCYRAWEYGLILVFNGTFSNVLDIVPPLVISKNEVDRGLDILEAAITDVEKGKVPDSLLEGFKAW